MKNLKLTSLLDQLNELLIQSTDNRAGFFAEKLSIPALRSIKGGIRTYNTACNGGPTNTTCTNSGCVNTTDASCSNLSCGSGGGGGNSIC